MAIPPSSRAQAEQIQQNLDKAQRFGLGKAFLSQWSIRHGETLAFLSLAWVLTVFEAAFWGFDWYSWIGEGFARALLWISILAVGVNGWFFWSLLGLETPIEVRPRGWARTAASALAALPLAGMVILPYWRRLSMQRSPWAFCTRPETGLFLNGQVRPIGRTVQRAHDAQIALNSSFRLGLGILLALGAGLGRLGVLRPSLPILAGFVAFHLAGFVADINFSRKLDLASGHQRMGPWLWLLPAPCHLLGFLWTRLPRESLRAAGGLITSIHSERKAQRRSSSRRSFLTLLYGPARSILSQWYWRRMVEPLPPLIGSRAQAKDRELVRCKMLLLFFDGFLLLGVTRLAAGRGFGLFLYLVSLAAFLISTLVAIPIWLTPVTQRAVGLNVPPQREDLKRTASILWLSQLAFFSGQQMAYSLIRAHDIWRWVGFASIIGSVMIVIVGLCSRRGQLLWHWIVFYLLVGAFFAQFDGDIAKLGAHSNFLLVVLFCLVPLGHLSLVRPFGDWLLWPISWRSAFDSRLPGKILQRTRCVALAAALPFGGLLAPLWPFLRPRLTQVAAKSWWLSAKADDLVKSQAIR